MAVPGTGGSVPPPLPLPLHDSLARAGRGGAPGPRKLPDLLTPEILPAEELRAAVLDGELFPLGDCFMPPDLPDTPEVRGRAFLHGLPGARLPAWACVAGLSAAWIHGALSTPPTTPWLGALGVPDTRDIAPLRVWLLRAHVPATDLARHAGLPVTTPTRTLSDLRRALARAPTPPADARGPAGPAPARGPTEAFGRASPGSLPAPCRRQLGEAISALAASLRADPGLGSASEGGSTSEPRA